LLRGKSMAVIRESKPPKGLRISELARLADVTIPTIKHYLKEGLLPRPYKTGRTMSYYDPECINRLRFIKKLQAERFLPLPVIKRVIESGGPIEDELALGEAFLGVHSSFNPQAFYTEDEILRQIDVRPEQLSIIRGNNLVAPVTRGTTRVYDDLDYRIVTLAKEREEMGIPFDYSMKLMSIYREHIRTIVKEDARLFLREIVRHKNTEEILRSIREGSRTLSAFMPIMKEKLMRQGAQRALEELNRASERIEEALRFRSLPDLWSDIADQRDLTDERSAARRAVLWAFQRDQGSSAENDISPETLFPLVGGIRALTNREGREALDQIGRVDPEGPFGCLIKAMAGTAYLILGSEGTGFLQIIEWMREAVVLFESSRIDTPYPNIELLAAYFRGVGLSIIPDVFDTHREARYDLNLVIFQSGRQQPVADTGISRFITELGLKSLYFKATVQIGATEYEAAKETLIKIKKTGIDDFYNQWVDRTMHEISGLTRSTPEPK
jgi:DNA-binding transcriptional MerR regulator